MSHCTLNYMSITVWYHVHLEWEYWCGTIWSLTTSGSSEVLPSRERPHFTQTPPFPAMALRDSPWAELAVSTYSAWPGRQEARKLLDCWFSNNPYGKTGLIAGDLRALEAKCEPPSQHCGTDTELWIWKLKFLATFQTYWLDSEQAACRQWIQSAFHQKCTKNILVNILKFMSI